MPDPRNQSERIYCQSKGCRGWWVHDASKRRGGQRRLYCGKHQDSYKRWQEGLSPEALRRRKAAVRKKLADQEDDRVGLRVDRPRYPRVPCERCLDRPARNGFSFCMQCSVCAACGKNKPEIKKCICRACKLAHREYALVRSRLPGEKAKKAVYHQRPEVKASVNENRRKRYASDPKFRETLIASSRKFGRKSRIAHRLRVVAMDRRVCAQRGCTKRLAGKIATAIYCSKSCSEKARYARRVAA